MSLLSAHTDEKEDVFTRSRAIFNTVRDYTHIDTYVVVHAHTYKKSLGHLQQAVEYPNYYQLPYINKLWHKSSDESATLNTLEKLPRLAYCRQTGQMRRRGILSGQQ